MTTLKDFVQINPQEKLTKGHEYPFVPMDAINPQRRYVEAPGFRVAGGGAKFRGGDTLFARITPCLENGKIAQFKADPKQVAFGSTEYWVLRAREGISDPAYVFYLASSDFLRKPAEQSMAGASGRQRADIAAIENLPIPVPSLKAQTKIASILSAYDDLIENNTRRIAILEEMARRLYEEWFVHFRFPGHEDVAFKESELGRIPAGWQYQPFTEIAEVLSGGTPKKSEERFWEGEIPFFTPKDAPTSFYALQTANAITPEGLAKCNSKLYPKDTVFITARGTVGKTALASADMAMNQSCYAFRGKGGYGQYFLFLAIRTAVDELKARSHGAVFDTIIVDTFRQLNAVIPLPAVVEEFQSVVSPLFELCLILQMKNRNLRAQRDLLLPKLVSGEINVSDLPIPDEASSEAA